jgi:hypothetical protein
MNGPEKAAQMFTTPPEDRLPIGVRPMGHQGLARTGISNIRYQLCVVARNVGELVDLAGGWICDRIRAGWDVNVAVPEPQDLRPLQILGVSQVTPQQLTLIGDGSGTASIAIAPGIFENDNHIRSEVLEALDQGANEITFVGPSLPSDLDGRLAKRQHRLSGAARAFKAHALAAAAVSSVTVNKTEHLYSSAPWYDASTNYDEHRLAVGQAGDLGEGT